MSEDMFILLVDDETIRSHKAEYFSPESHAREAATRVARGNRGARVSIAKVIATVTCPLADVKWEGDDEPSATDFSAMEDGVVNVTGSNQIRDPNAPKQVGYPAPNYTETLNRRK